MSVPFYAPPDGPWSLQWRCRFRGPAVTIRVSLVFVRADSSSPVVMVTGSPDLPERHSGFVRASRFQRSAFDLLRLPSSLRLSAPCAM
jgi:hypothetical protein